LTVGHRLEVRSVKLQLLVIEGPDKGKAFPLSPGPHLMVGRCHSAYYQLHDEKLSRNHCQILLNDDRVTVIDNGGNGGTFVNNQKIDRQDLKEGDILQIGDSHLRFHIGEAPAEEAEPIAADFEVVEDKPVLEALSNQKFSHFDVGEVVGKGRDGVVFRATDTKTNHAVALKVLREEFGHRDEAVQHFVKAMKAVLPLRHAHLITVHAAGKSGPHCWVSMDYVEGKPLTQVVERFRTEGKPDWHFACKVAFQVCEALDYVHQHDLVHGHLTPANLFRDATTKEVRLGDLMLAKSLEETQDGPLDEESEVEPDTGYLAPERTHGWAQVDARSDLYGLGATLYALLTGRPPFTAQALQHLLGRIREQNPERPTKHQRTVPPWFEKAVLKLLAKKPKDRYQSAADFLADLEQSARIAGLEV
jgi:hypothetical protein